MGSRLVQIACGIGMLLLSLIAGLSAFATVSVYELSIMTLVLALVAAFLAVGLAVPGVRLVTGTPRPDGGLFPRWALRLAAVWYIGLPVAALVTGEWRELRFGAAQLVIQGTIYIGVGVALYRLAARRASESYWERRGNAE